MCGLLMDPCRVHKISPASADAPTNVNVTRNGNDFEITWDAPIEADGRSKNIVDYQVFYKDDINGGNWISQLDNYGLNNYATVTGLTIPEVTLLKFVQEIPIIMEIS